MNVTEDLLRNYIEVFHKTYIDTARQFLQIENLQFLSRFQFSSSGIIGYVSTNFGAGFEYIGETSPGISIQRSSARIEDLFTNAPARVRRLQPMFDISASNIKLIGLTLKGWFPFRLTSQEASVSFTEITFTVGDWSRLVKHAELYGNRTKAFWSEINAVSKAKDEILLALVYLKESEKRSIPVSEYLKTFKEKMVLVLGDYGDDGIKRLKEIKKILIILGYVPICLNEIPDDLHYDLQQKAVAVGSVARFVVMDDSSKSGHLVELQHAQFNRWFLIILRLEGSDGSFMTRGASATSKVILENSYSTDNLHEVLNESVRWAEERIEENKRTMMGVYPWRKDSVQKDTASLKMPIRSYNIHFAHRLGI